MTGFFEHAAEIIRAAAANPLGICALMILTLGFLGFVYFRHASERTRIAIFVLMFLGVAIFVVAMFIVNMPLGVDLAGYHASPPVLYERTVEAGMENYDIPSSGDLVKKITLRLEENAQPVGLLDLSFFPKNTIFKINKLTDSRGRAVQEYKNSTRGGDKDVLQSWDTLEFKLGAYTYALRIGYHGGGNIRISYFKRI